MRQLRAKIGEAVGGYAGSVAAPAAAADQAAAEPVSWADSVSERQVMEADELLDEMVLDRAHSCAADVGWVAEARSQHRGAPDATLAFRDALQEVQSGKRELARRWDLSYVIVPGLFCSHYPLYMSWTKSHLRDVGLDLRVLKTLNTEASVEANAADIAKQLVGIHQQCGKRVVLLGHSKGGCDALAAVSRHTAMLPFVVAVVGLQAPLGGTPLATDVEAQPTLRKAFNKIVTTIGGDAACLKDMTYARRKEELDRFPAPASVPVFSLSTASVSKLSPLCPLQKYMGRRYSGLANDGMVASPDADLPGSTRIFVEGEMDHGGCAFPALPGAKLKGELVNEACLLLVSRAVPPLTGGPMQTAYALPGPPQPGRHADPHGAQDELV